MNVLTTSKNQNGRALTQRRAGERCSGWRNAGCRRGRRRGSAQTPALVRPRAMTDSARLGLALNAASTLAFRGVVHTKVNAVPLFCVVDKKIFQNVLPVCWGERFFADSAVNQAARKFGVGTHTNKLVA